MWVDPRIKTNALGVAWDWNAPPGKPQFIRGDYDPAAIIDAHSRLVPDPKVEAKYLGPMNKALTGSPKLTQFMHSTHWTYANAAKIDRPGDLLVFRPDGTVSLSSDWDFAKQYNLRWFSEWGAP
jgi:hypothetical protein